MQKKILCICLSVFLFSAAALSAAGLGTESYVQLVHIRNAADYDVQTTVYFSTLEQAVQEAESGDIIEVFADVTVTAPILIPDGMELTIVSGKKREHTAIFGRSAFEDTDPNAPIRTIRKDFDGSLFVLGENSRVVFGRIVLDGSGRSGDKGGLIFVGPSSTLEVGQDVTMKNSALGNASTGGAVYVAASGHASFDKTTFENNRAAVGPDVFGEDGACIVGLDEAGTEFGTSEDTSPESAAQTDAGSASKPGQTDPAEPESTAQTDGSIGPQTDDSASEGRQAGAEESESTDTGERSGIRPALLIAAAVLLVAACTAAVLLIRKKH